MATPAERAKRVNRRETPWQSQIAFSDFLLSTFPHLGQHLPLISKAEQLVVGLEEIAEIDPDGSIGYVRGGSMRVYLHQTQAVEQNICDHYSHLPDELLGSNPLTRQVIDHAFGLKDVDIHINRNFRFRRNDQATLAYLNSLAMISGYRVETEVLKAGDKSFFHLTFFREKSLLPLLIISINDTSQTLAEMVDDIRDEPNAAKIDQLARGKIFLTKNKPILAYDRGHLADFLMETFIDSAKKHQGFKPDLTVSQLIGGLRTAGFAAFFTPYLLLHPEIADSPLLRFAIRGWNPIPEEGNREKMAIWKLQHIDELEKRRILVVSDALFPLTINPSVFLLVAFFNGHLQYLPLGQIVNDEKKLLSVLIKLAEAAGANITRDSFWEICMNEAENFDENPFLLVKALKDLNLLPGKTAENMDSVVRLLDPTS